MSRPIRIEDVERFRLRIAERMGLHFDDAKLGSLADLLGARVDASHCPLDAYLTKLGSERDEIRALAAALTVPETYFFRHADQFRAFAETALPARFAARAGERKLRIMSLGCASGEEPYTLAMVVRDALPAEWTPPDVSISGIDVNAVALDRARRAQFSPWALRETPDEHRRRWMVASGKTFRLDPAIVEAVRFEERNLIDDDPSFWPAGAVDVIFCRNVLMYFEAPQAAAVVARISRALAPGGFLFLGHAENLRGLSTDFHLCHTHGTFYYQRKTAADERRGSDRAAPSLPAAVVAAVSESETWVDAIRRASERVTTLTSGSPETIQPSLRQSWDLSSALELLRQERIAEALSTVESLPPESTRDPDVLLLRAALLTHRGELERAEAACVRVLDDNELSAGARYLLALCREGAGDRIGAEQHDRAAVYLDPAFAMPRLHLGLLARRAGDLPAARRELGQALMLLQAEDASRLLLFGGGFGREALIALCRTELLRCGGMA